jgi:hypothetical protein
MSEARDPIFVSEYLLTYLQAEDPDNFETWEKLVRGAEALEGGINRNSSPQAITTVRSCYDRFLAKFPLLFGYWKKYADLEFSITGTEAAEMVRTLLPQPCAALRILQRNPLTCFFYPGLRKRHCQYLAFS